MSTQPTAAPLVNVTIDGKKVAVPKGTNLIDAAKAAGVDVPYYCYHPHLSVAGNCRMCQVEVKGQPKLTIGCNTTVSEGMEVLTQNTSKAVKDAQAATLEFILINHPLDCTVCDQAGHCKLQDYHYEYNAKPSRFLEEKEHKVKAEPLGPNVILDGERCIMCTRCIRFCDEVTGTSELGMLNRGDRSVIAINPGKELNNPLSGSVVDLCPVGALTHRPWRFNSRIWFSKQTDSICPGCSTGCNVKVATRDNTVVQVKARLNSDVNKEWMCDEGRYGFQRYLPEKRLGSARVAAKEVPLAEALKAASAITSDRTVVFVDANLLLEEMFVLKQFIDKVHRNAEVVIGYRERTLNAVEKILISPDYAANFQGAVYAGLVQGDLQAGYVAALKRVRDRGAANILIVGERGILPEDRDDGLLAGVAAAKISVGILTDASSPLVSALKVVLPGRSVLEKSGVLVNRALRAQYAERCVDFPTGSEPDWRLINALAGSCGAKVTSAVSDRDATIAYLAAEPRLAGLSIARIKAGGVCLKTYSPGAGAGPTSQHSAA